MLLGVDYGTTRTVVARVDRGNYPVVSFQTPSGDTQEWYPSLIAAREGKRLYGLQAAARVSEPGWFFYRSFKRELATLGPDSEVVLGNYRVTALDLLIEFLSQLHQDLRERSNLRIRPKETLETIISVPANSNSNQRFITLEAFRRAGFQVRQMMNEPSAAGIEYAHHYLTTGAPSRREHLIVYDLGGGTFDASVVSMADRRHEVISSQGVARLGGDDFDSILLELALVQGGVRSFPEEARFRLLEECREKKESLHPNSRKIAVDLGCAFDGAGDVTVSIAEFYERCRPLVERTMETMRNAIQRASAELPDSWNSVAGVYVVGGSSNLPLVARLLREEYGRQVRKSPYPHASTAIGLAIAADSQPGYRLRERFTHNFSVWREAEAGSCVVLDVLFTKDTPLPENVQESITCSRSYVPVHNIGHFRFVECESINTEGQPSGDLMPWEEIYFPFDPALEGRQHLAEIPIERAHLPDQFVEEVYTCDRNGIIEVRITNRTTQFCHTYRLRGRR